MDELRVSLCEGQGFALEDWQRSRRIDLIRELTGLDRAAAEALLDTGGVLVDGYRASAARRLAQHCQLQDIAIEIEPSPAPVERERGTGVRDPAFEAQLRADPSDRDAHLVYGDWLQARGDPLGDLIALQAELAQAEGEQRLALEARDRAFRRTHARALFGSLHPFADAIVQRWSLGFIDAATVGLDTHDGRTLPIRLLPELLRLPIAARMTSLSLPFDLLRRRDIDRVLCKSEVVANLRTLELRERPHSQINEAQPKLVKLWPHLRKLETLIAHGDSPPLSDLNVGTLRHLWLRRDSTGGYVCRALPDKTTTIERVTVEIAKLERSSSGLFSMFCYCPQRLRVHTLAVVTSAPINPSDFFAMVSDMMKALHAQRLDLSGLFGKTSAIATIERMRSQGLLRSNFEIYPPA